MIPENLDDIHTNVDIKTLERIIEQIRNKKIKFTDVSLFAHECGANFIFENRKYKIVEEWEVIVSIHLREDNKNET